MPRVSGVYSLPPSYKATAGQTIRTSQHNPPLEDIAQALTDSLPRDGSAAMSSDLPMNGRRVKNVGAATDDADAVRLDQVTQYDPWLASLASLAMAENKLPYASGSSTAALTEITPFARSVLDDADAETARTTLGVVSLDKATTGQAEAGSDDAAYMTPLKVAQAIANASVQPKAQEAGGVGRVLELSSKTLPSGGIWFYFAIGFSGGVDAGHAVGVASGGTTFSMGGGVVRGFAWRIE